MKYMFSWKKGKMHWSYPELVPQQIRVGVRNAILDFFDENNIKSYKKQYGRFKKKRGQ
jgi:hypothetical protein